MEEEEREQFAAIARALSDPIRLQILNILVEGRDSSCRSTPHPQLPQAICPYLDIQPRLKGMSRSKLSYHFKELRDAGLLEEHRMGKQVFYLIKKERLEQAREMIRQAFLLDYQA